MNSNQFSGVLATPVRCSSGPNRTNKLSPPNGSSPSFSSFTPYARARLTPKSKQFFEDSVPKHLINAVSSNGTFEQSHKKMTMIFSNCVEYFAAGNERAPRQFYNNITNLVSQATGEAFKLDTVRRFLKRKKAWATPDKRGRKKEKKTLMTKENGNGNLLERAAEFDTTDRPNLIICSDITWARCFE